MMYPKPPGKPTGMKVSPKDAASAKVKFATLKENKPAPTGMKELPITRRAVGKAIGAVAGAKAEYKYLAKKADFATPSGKLYKAMSETKPLPITRRAVGKAIGAVAGAKAEYKYLAKKADYVTAEGKFTKKKK